MTGLINRRGRHVEYLYALGQRQKDGTLSMCYLLQPTRPMLWETIVDTEFLGTGHTKQTLQRAGWKPVKVRVEEAS